MVPSVGDEAHETGPLVVRQTLNAKYAELNQDTDAWFWGGVVDEVAKLSDVVKKFSSSSTR